MHIMRYYACYAEPYEWTQIQLTVCRSPCAWILLHTFLPRPRPLCSFAFYMFVEKVTAGNLPGLNFAEIYTCIQQNRLIKW